MENTTFCDQQRFARALENVYPCYILVYGGQTRKSILTCSTIKMNVVRCQDSHITNEMKSYSFSNII